MLNLDPNNPSIFNNTEWGIGVVEDREDPLEIGRVRVRFLNIHTEDKTKMPTDSLPWALVMNPVTDASQSGVGKGTVGLVPGSYVFAIFLDGQNKQMPLILGSIPGIPSIKKSPDVGYSDSQINEPVPPAGISVYDDGFGSRLYEKESEGYPKTNSIGSSSLPKTSRGEESGTLIEIIRKLRDIGQTNIPSANGYYMGNLVDSGEPFSEPETQFAPQYPFNHVTATESGHLIEIDDTPGAERLLTAHRSGTFNEVHPDGTKVTKVVNDNYTVVMKDDFVHIEGNATVTIDKGMRILVNKDGEETDYNLEIFRGADCNITVQQGDINLNVLNGNLNTYVNGDEKKIVTGNSTQIVMGDTTIWSGKNSILASGITTTIVSNIAYLNLAGYSATRLAGAQSLNLTGISSFHITGATSVTQTGISHIINTLGTYSLTAGGLASHTVGGAYLIQVGGVYSLISGAAASNLSGGIYSIIAPVINLN